MEGLRQQRAVHHAPAEEERERELGLVEKAILVNVGELPNVLESREREAGLREDSADDLGRQFAVGEIG